MNSHSSAPVSPGMTRDELRAKVVNELKRGALMDTICDRCGTWFWRNTSEGDLCRYNGCNGVRLSVANLMAPPALSRETPTPAPTKEPATKTLDEIRERIASHYAPDGSSIVAVCLTKGCVGWCCNIKSIGDPCNICNTRLVDARPYLVAKEPAMPTMKTPDEIRASIISFKNEEGGDGIGVCPKPGCQIVCTRPSSIGKECRHCGTRLIDARPYLVTAKTHAPSTATEAMNAATAEARRAFGDDHVATMLVSSSMVAADAPRYIGSVAGPVSVPGWDHTRRRVWTSAVHVSELDAYNAVTAYCRTLPDFQPANPLLKTLEVDATEAAWRMAGSQFVKLAKEPLISLLSRHIGPDDESLRAKIAAFLDTEMGAAILSGVLSAGLSAMPLPANDVSQRLSRELRVRSMASAGDVLVDVLAGPLRQVACTYLQGEPAAPTAPAQLVATSRVGAQQTAENVNAVVTS